MIIKKTSFILLLATVLLALTCGGQSTSNGILMNKVTGNFDIEINKQKTFWASKNISAVAYDLDDPSITWPCTINGSQFSFNMVRRSNVVIKISLDEQVVMSKVLARENTNFNTISDIKINTISHVHSLMVQKHFNSAFTKEWSYQDSIKSINSILLGITIPSNDQIKLSQVNKTSPIIAAIISTYSHLLTAESLTSHTETLSLFEKTFSQTNLFIIENQYLQLVNIAKVNVAETIASLHEAAKNSKVISNKFFSSISDRLTSEIILIALDKFKEEPVFNTDIDNVRIAAPGTLFQYNFPSATTKDVLGIFEYKGKWIKNSTTNTPYDGKSNNNKTIKWIPSEAEVGKSFFYQLDAVGANGKISSKPKVIEITVKDLEIIADERKMLPHKPIYGPVLYGDYAYLVSAHTDNSQLNIEKYLLSDLATIAPDTMLDPISWTIPYSSEVYDMKIYNNIIYLATQANTISAYDALWEQDNQNPPTLVGSVSATHLEIISDQLYSISNSFTALTIKSNLNLEGSANISTFDNFIIDSSVKMGQINSNYLYLTKSNSGIIYSQNDSGQLSEVVNFTPLALNHLPKSEASSIQTEFLYSGNTVQSLNISLNNLKLDTYSPINLQPYDGITSNGTYFFSVNASNNIIFAHSLLGDVKVSDDSTNKSTSINYRNISKDIRFMIHNLPEGLSSNQSGAYLYSFGQGTNDQFTATWFIKRHKLKPID